MINRFQRFLLRVLFRLCHVRVYGLAPYKRNKKPRVFVSNLCSVLDALILYAFLPNRPLFALTRDIYHKHKIRWIIPQKDIVPFQPLDVGALKKLLEQAQKGRSIVLFAEGRMSVTGELLKLYEAPGFLADKTHAPLVPVWISGSQYNYFAHANSPLPRRLFPLTKVTFGKEQAFSIPPSKRKDRNAISHALYRLMVNLSFEVIYQPKKSLFDTLMRTAKIYSKSDWFHRPTFVADATHPFQSYKDILVQIFLYGRAFKRYVARQQGCGILLPNSLEAVYAFFGLTAYERVAVMLNPTLSATQALSALRTASVKTVLTSRQWIEELNLTGLIDALKEKDIRILYTEDMQKSFHIFQKIKAWVSYKTAYVPYPFSGPKRAAILFTSGTESRPKAVVLSHQNLLANVYQLFSLINITPSDTLFNILPMFHSFGLTAGTLYPLLCGGRLFLYPSPLHYRIIDELIYSTGATILFGTDTFLRGYARVAHPYDFHTLRVVLGGAEPMREDTRHMWMEQFGIRLLEGYGTTETSPILTINNHIFCRFGSVGQFLPGLQYKIKPLPDFPNNQGVLCVKGPNVMMGTLQEDKPGLLHPCPGGWYETGDVVEMDDMGFVYIKDRLKRFAKIGGEMISLTAIEQLAREAYHNDASFVAVNVPHAAKGEQIVLWTDDASANLDVMRAYLQKQGYNELFLPTRLMHIEAIPVLANGKTDYRTLKEKATQE
ncbi:MAG: AMP-binding protein [Alphaproteobacteria bacterium]|nr:AMP-binding protein [Alphaproteobacteria bacterium]